MGQEFVVRPMVHRLQEHGLTVGDARRIAERYAECCNCGCLLGDDITGGTADNSGNIDFKRVTCSECDQRQSVLVEEKVWGLGADNVLEGAETFEYETATGETGVFFLNPRQVMVSSGWLK